jgi:hypothetical protein
MKIARVCGPANWGRAIARRGRGKDLLASGSTSPPQPLAAQMPHSFSSAEPRDAVFGSTLQVFRSCHNVRPSLSGLKRNSLRFRGMLHARFNSMEYLRQVEMHSLI